MITEMNDSNYDELYTELQNILDSKGIKNPSTTTDNKFKITDYVHALRNINKSESIKRLIKAYDDGYDKKVSSDISKIALECYNAYKDNTHENIDWIKKPQLD